MAVARIICFILLASKAEAKLEKDKEGIYSFTFDNIEEGIKTLDSVVVAFYSPKCHSCRLLESELSQIVAILTSKGLEIDVAKADVSQSRALGDRYQLQKLPTLMFFVADGIVKYQGPHKAAEISKWLEKVCASPGAFIG